MPSEKNRVGDNCYFIGFVYTLIVVAVTLHKLPTLADGEYDIELLMQAVAIALSTSVIGMVWRFIIVEELEDEEDKLGKMIAQFAEAVSSVNGTTEQLRDTVQQLGGAVEMSRDSFERAATEADKCAESLRGILDKAKNSMDAAVQNLFNTFSEKVTEAFSAEPFITVRRELQTAIRQHNAVAAELKEKIGEAFSNLKNTVDSVSDQNLKMEESLSKIAKMSESPEWKKTVGALSDFADKLEQMRQSTKDISAESGAYVAAMGSVKAALDKHVKEIEGDVAQMAELKEKYRKAHQDAAKAAIEETQKLYADLIVGASVALKNSKELEELAKNLRAVANKAGR